MTTPEELGMVQPAGTDYINKGDDAISQNARATAAMYDKLQPYMGQVTRSGDFNQLLGKGPSTDTYYWVNSGAANGPPVPWSGWCRVIVSANGLAAVQTFTRSDGAAIWQRSYLNGSGGIIRWTDWRRIDADPLGGSGSARSVLMDDFTYRRGGVKQIGNRASVSFRIDHGLANFNTKMRPKLEALGFKYAIAMGSRMWSQSENVGVTPAMVNTWVSGGLAEIWSHGPSHADTSDTAKILDYIVNSKKELESDIPAAAPIDGFMPPGASGDGGYGGFIPSTTPEKYYGTYAGQLAMETYAVCSGQFPGTAYRVQDGRPRVGQSYFNMEAQSASGIVSRVNNAINSGKGIQLMIHPSLIDTPGYITTAELASALDQIKALQTAGKIIVMSAYDQTLADSTSPITIDQTAGRAVKVWDYLNNRDQIIYGSTGIRDVSSVVGNLQSGSIEVSRENNRVFYKLYNVVPTDPALPITLGTAFARGNGYYNSEKVWHRLAPYGAPIVTHKQMATAGSDILIGAPVAAGGVSCSFSHPTADPWPTTLPGVAQ